MILMYSIFILSQGESVQILSRGEEMVCYRYSSAHHRVYLQLPDVINALVCKHPLLKLIDSIREPNSI